MSWKDDFREPKFRRSTLGRLRWRPGGRGVVIVPSPRRPTLPPVAPLPDPDTHAFATFPFEDPGDRARGCGRRISRRDVPAADICAATLRGRSAAASRSFLSDRWRRKVALALRFAVSASVFL